MSLINYFKPVETITQEDAREMIKGQRTETFIFLDVRQLKEYERGHIPGSVLIPIAELPERLDELDPSTKIIAYCAIGGRSRAAASILSDAGFEHAYNLKGGFNLWNGLSAPGPPETGIAYFKDAAGQPEEIIPLAWALEEGMRRFYLEMAQREKDAATQKVYDGLKNVEINHQKMLAQLYRETIGAAPGDETDFLKKYMPADHLEHILEGQMKLGEMLEWVNGRPMLEVLEYAIALEAKLYDLYHRMKEKYKDVPTVYKLYSQLAEEEHQHLELFIDLLEEHA